MSSKPAWATEQETVARCGYRVERSGGRREGKRSGEDRRQNLLKRGSSLYHTAHLNAPPLSVRSNDLGARWSVQNLCFISEEKIL